MSQSVLLPWAACQDHGETLQLPSMHPPVLSALLGQIPQPDLPLAHGPRAGSLDGKLTKYSSPTHPGLTHLKIIVEQDSTAPFIKGAHKMPGSVPSFHQTMALG